MKPVKWVKPERNPSATTVYAIRSKAGDKLLFTTTLNVWCEADDEVLLLPPTSERNYFSWVQSCTLEKTQVDY